MTAEQATANLTTALAQTPIDVAVDAFFAYLAKTFPAYAILINGANGVIDFILQKEGL